MEESSDLMEEEREDVSSIHPLLPLILRSSTFYWPPKALESLKALALGPDVSRVDSGEILFDAILDLRDAVGLSSERLASRAADGFTLFFDELMSRMDAMAWFGDVVPELARLLLRLPDLLDAHYRDPDDSRKLRLLGQQVAGVVFLSQELIAALLACALFCLFPNRERADKNLSDINFDRLFAALHPNPRQSQEQKVKCLVHYFERICFRMPMGFVSFERKVLPLDHTTGCISYPEDVFWITSVVPLCPFKVFSSGMIEDQQYEALEVDFANKFLGGGALHTGCVQVFDDASIQVMSPDTHAPLESGDNMDTIKNSCYDKCHAENCQNNIGIATGNWGCGAFGGNPEIKCMIQWLAASQALRPFIHYYTFEQAALMKLGQVTDWIMLHKWTVGDLWNMLVEYSSQRLNRKTSAGFLSWLLPGDDASSSEHLMCE